MPTKDATYFCAHRRRLRSCRRCRSCRRRDSRDTRLGRRTAGPAAISSMARSSRIVCGENTAFHAAGHRQSWSATAASTRRRGRRRCRRGPSDQADGNAVTVGHGGLLDRPPVFQGRRRPLTSPGKPRFGAWPKPRLSNRSHISFGVKPRAILAVPTLDDFWITSATVGHHADGSRKWSPDRCSSGPVRS